MSDLQQLEKEAEAAWVEYQKAEAVVLPIRDKWARLSRQVEREKLKVQLKAEMEAELTKQTQ